MKSMGGFGGSNVMNTSNNEAASLTPTPRSNKLSRTASRPMSPISEIDVKPGFSSRLPPRTLSGGLNRSFGNEGSASSKLTSLARTQSGGLDQYKTKVLSFFFFCEFSRVLSNDSSIWKQVVKMMFILMNRMKIQEVDVLLWHITWVCPSLYQILNSYSQILFLVKSEPSVVALLILEASPRE